MNSLSWFLYLADVVSNLSFVLTTLGFLGLIAGSWAALLFYVEDKHILPILIAVISALMLFAAALLPSKSTMYAIAASELGEQAAKSELGQKGIKAIEAWIDEQLKGKK